MAVRFAAVLLVILVFPSAPGAAHDDPPERCDCFGTVVDALDPDANTPAMALPIGSLVVADMDASGWVSAADTALVVGHAWSGVVGVGHLRITGAAGTWVQPGDTEVGVTAFALPGAWVFYDANGNGWQDGGDWLYWDTDMSGTISAMDIRVSGDGGVVGAWVNAADSDVGRPLMYGWGELVFWDIDGDGVAAPGDIYYFDLRRDLMVGAGDVRLSGRLVDLHAEPLTSVSSEPAVSVPALRAHLDDRHSGQPIVGAPVSFYAGDEQLCTALTDASGEAICRDGAAVALALAAGTYRAEFRGHQPYCGASSDGAVVALDGATVA